MPQDRQSIGRLGEQAAAEMLERAGYGIACRNFRTRLGEIDIIAFDEKYIVFVEVKTRSRRSLCEPREAVGYRKQVRIIKAAEEYLARNGMTLQPRFDVIEVLAGPGGAPEEVRHIPNAFTL